MGNESFQTTTVAPQLQPPIMEVGYNYTWAFNRYGTTIGPRDLENDPPTGANDAVPPWRDKVKHPPGGSLARNLKILRDQLKIKKVRIFLLGNAFNYGKRPFTNVTSSGKSFFTAPVTPHPLFFDHFRQMLEVFTENEMQILPSVIDFGAFYPLGGGAGGGRTSILTSQRSIFLETMLAPLLKISQEPNFPGTVFAWEAVNEPVWNTISAPFFGRPHTSSSARDVDVDIMSSFLNDCLRVIKGHGFDFTVGHRFLNNLTGKMPAGNVPQFHYYGGTGFARSLVDVDDPDPIPKFSDLASDPRPNGAIIGEFATAPGGDKNQFGDEEPGSPWPECQGRDKTRRRAAFERLTVLARKGYKLAFVWPDRSDKEAGVVIDDELKLTNEAQESIKEFTRGRFPNGVP